jgi:DNA-binding PadR family transcriptional regulator
MIPLELRYSFDIIRYIEIGGHMRHHRWNHEGAHGRHGRGWRRGRVFDHGELRPVILKLIADKPRHGYDVIKAIEERLGGAYSPSPGVIYPTLAMLEEMGHIVQTVGEGKKLYTVTATGTGWLDENRVAVEAIFARMDQAGAALGPSPPIMRAMENLRLALRLRLEQGPVTPDQARAIAAAIDAAATAVESVAPGASRGGER